MNRLPRDHPEIVALHRQLQEQHKGITESRISVALGWKNIDDLRTQLWERGWNSRLADDQITVVLLEREEPNPERLIGKDNDMNHKETIEQLQNVSEEAAGAWKYTETQEEERQANMLFALCQIALQLDRIAEHLENGQIAILDTNRP